MRVIFIGCTNLGIAINAGDMKKMFDQTLYFGSPSFSDRFKIWKHQINKKIGKDYDIEYDVLAHVSVGYAPEGVILI